MCVCVREREGSVCVCVCERERGRESERGAPARRYSEGCTLESARCCPCSGQQVLVAAFYFGMELWLHQTDDPIDRQPTIPSSFHANFSKLRSTETWSVLIRVSGS